MECQGTTTLCPVLLHEALEGTPAAPGTNRKMDVLGLRALLGRPLFHPADARVQSEDSHVSGPNAAHRERAPKRRHVGRDADRGLPRGVTYLPRHSATSPYRARLRGELLGYFATAAEAGAVVAAALAV